MKAFWEYILVLLGIKEEEVKKVEEVKKENTPLVLNSRYPDLKSMWENFEPKDLSEIQPTLSKILASVAAYNKVSVVTKVPWQVIAVIHYRESSLSFKGVLHNGERILGTGKKTMRVPSGRGPFTTWEEAAIDALNLKKANFPKSWTPENCLEFLERYNGIGYRYRGVFSPYLWSKSPFYSKGKFVSDGVYSSEAVDSQIGCAILLKGLGM